MNHLNEEQLLNVKCDDLPWRPSDFASGVSVKDIAATGGLEMQIVQCEPGARFPVHMHETPEFIYILEGELYIDGETLGPGYASVAAKGSEHSDVHSVKGCTFVLVDRP